jgi:hypothetical protein
MSASANAAGCRATSAAVTAAVRNVPASRNRAGGRSPALYSPTFREVGVPEVRGGRNLHDEVVGARVPLRGKNSRTGRSRPASESAMNTIWWTCSLPGGNPPTRCAVQKTG